MTPAERWRHVQQLAEEAESWPSPERLTRLAAREPDASLRAEAIGLLAALAAESSAEPVAAVATPEIPAQIGPFRITGLLGSGGRSLVYAGERTLEHATQQAAVKVLQEHLISPEDLDRFRREQVVLASMEHPAIARFLDAGRDASGRPYLAMERIDGLPFDAYCDAASLSIAARIRLVVAVADAVAEAHRRLIVHLDLKPSNILVDRRGQVKLLDFGTAKLLRAEGDLTTTRQLTPQYASPEQLRGEAVSTACDVYSLGLVLYEALCGAWPFASRHSLAALAERAAGAATVRRFEVSAEAARKRGATPGQLGSLLRGDLDAIVRKALQPEAARRYASAEDFALDLRAYLEVRPVRARPPALGDRLFKFVRRNRVVAGVAAAAAVAVLALGSYALAEQRRRLAEAERARETARFLSWMLESSSVFSSGRTQLTLAELAERAAARIARGDGPPPVVAATIETQLARLLLDGSKTDLAEQVALRAADRARPTGDPNARLGTLHYLAYIRMWRGHCADAALPFSEADRLVAAERPRISPVTLVAYLTTRSQAKSRCDGDLAAAADLAGQALAASDAVSPRDLPVPPGLHRASILNIYASASLRAQRYADARRAVAEGLSLAAAHPDGKGVRIALLRTRLDLENVAGDPAAALAGITEAAALAPGVVNPYEEIRLRIMLAAQLARTGQREAATARAREGVAEYRRRAAEVGPGGWMLLTNAAEALSRAGACQDVFVLYREVDRATGGAIPRDWLANRYAAEADCLAATDPAAASRRAAQALETLSTLLPATSPRRIHLERLRDRGLPPPAASKTLP